MCISGVSVGKISHNFKNLGLFVMRMVHGLPKFCVLLHRDYAK